MGDNATTDAVDTITIDDVLQMIRDAQREVGPLPKRHPLFGPPGLFTGGMPVHETPPRTVWRVKRCRGTAHPLIHWLARFLPIETEIEWDWPEQAPDDKAWMIHSRLLEKHLAQHRALLSMTPGA